MCVCLFLYALISSSYSLCNIICFCYILNVALDFISRNAHSHHTQINVEFLCTLNCHLSNTYCLMFRFDKCCYILQMSGKWCRVLLWLDLMKNILKYLNICVSFYSKSILIYYSCKVLIYMSVYVYYAFNCALLLCLVGLIFQVLCSNQIICPIDILLLREFCVFYLWKSCALYGLLANSVGLYVLASGSNWYQLLRQLHLYKFHSKSHIFSNS